MIENGHMSNQEYHDSSGTSTQQQQQQMYFNENEQNSSRQQYNHRNAAINNQHMNFPPPRHNDVRSPEQTSTYNSSQAPSNVAHSAARNNNTNNDRLIPNDGNNANHDPRKAIRPKVIPLPREGKPPSTNNSNTAYKLQPREPPLPPQSKFIFPSLGPVVKNKSSSSNFIKINQDLMWGKAFDDPSSCNGNAEPCSNEFDPINYHIIECLEKEDSARESL